MRGDNDNLTAKVKRIPESQRSAIISSFKEIDLHQQLKMLFGPIYPDKEVLVTHGVDEYGKDLVIIDRYSISVSATALVAKKGKVTAKAGGVIAEIRDRVGMTFVHSYSTTAGLGDCAQKKWAHILRFHTYHSIETNE